MKIAGAAGAAAASAVGAIGHGRNLDGRNFEQRAEPGCDASIHGHWTDAHARYCVVVATLVDDTGAPLVGVSIADIRLVDATSLPVGVGPYMFGASGDIVDSNTLRASASFNGRSRVAFLDVPAGTLTLTVMYSRDGKVVTHSSKVITQAGAITAVQP